MGLLLDANIFDVIVRRITGTKKNLYKVLLSFWFNQQKKF